MEPEDEYAHDDEQAGMRPLSRALFINLVIVILYAGVLMGLKGSQEGLFISGIIMMAQAAVNLVVMIVMFVMRKKEWGLGLLLSALILGVVGFSACLSVFPI